MKLLVESDFRPAGDIIGSTFGLISSRTKLINNLRGWLRGQGLRLSSGRAETFAGRMAEIKSPGHSFSGWKSALEATRPSSQD